MIVVVLFVVRWFGEGQGGGGGALGGGRGASQGRAVVVVDAVVIVVSETTIYELIHDIVANCKESSCSFFSHIQKLSFVLDCECCYCEHPMELQ